MTLRRPSADSNAGDGLVVKLAGAARRLPALTQLLINSDDNLINIVNSHFSLGLSIVHGLALGH